MTAEEQSVRSIFLVRPGFDQFTYVLYTLWFSHRVTSDSFATPMDCSLPGSSVHGNSHRKILERVAISFSRGSSQPRDQICSFCTAGRFCTPEPPVRPTVYLLCTKPSELAKLSTTESLLQKRPADKRTRGARKAQWL